MNSKIVIYSIIGLAMVLSTYILVNDDIEILAVSQSSNTSNVIMTMNLSKSDSTDTEIADPLADTTIDIIIKHTNGTELVKILNQNVQTGCLDHAGFEVCLLK